MKVNFLALIILSLSLVNTTYAGSESHGGVGVISGSKLFVLDLYEAGLEENSYFDNNITPEAGMTDRISSIFLDAPSFPTALLAKKLSEISRVNRLLAFSIIRGMELLNWRFVNANLINTNDEDASIVIDPQMRVQIALRKNSNISINKGYWEKLDDQNKVALILHEVIFSFVRQAVYQPTSFSTREVVSFLMSKKMDPYNASANDELIEVIGNQFEFAQAMNSSCKDNFSTKKKNEINCGTPKAELYVWFKESRYFPTDRQESTYPKNYVFPYTRKWNYPIELAKEDAFLQVACEQIKVDYKKLANLEGDMIALMHFTPYSMKFDIYRDYDGLKVTTTDDRNSLRVEGGYTINNEINCSTESIIPADAKKLNADFFKQYTSNSWN